MLVLLDNDCGSKLAILDLVDAALGQLGAARADIRVLETAKYRWARNRKAWNGVRDRHGEPAADRVLSLFEAATVVPAPADDALGRFVSAGVDPGEAVLFANANGSDALVCTGDKRAIRALATAPTVSGEPVADALLGKIVCFETLLHTLLTASERRDAIVAQLVGGRRCDTGLDAILGSGRPPDPDHVLAGLESYRRDLERTAGGLAWRPLPPTVP